MAQQQTEELPTQFQERIRSDIVKRAVLSIRSKKRQSYGAEERAGKKHVTRWRKRNNAYRSQKGRGESRTPRKIMNARGMQLWGEGAEAPNTRGGRTAHPPKPEKDFTEEINDKERRKAIRSAIAATTDQEMVQKHHRYDGDLPLISEEIENIEKTSDLQEHLEELGLEEELQRAKKKKVRSGKGKNRGRKYVRRVGPLVVTAENNEIKRAASNIPGVEATTVDQLNAEKLAPSTEPGRLTVWSQKSIEKLNENKLFN